MNKTRQIIEKLERVLNEISDSTANAVLNRREDNLSVARKNFVDGSGSLDSMKKAKNKYDNVNKLLSKRGRNLKGNHVVLLADEYKEYKSGKRAAEDTQVGEINDNQLLKLANLEVSCVRHNEIVSTLEEAKNLVKENNSLLTVFANDRELMWCNVIQCSEPSKIYVFLDSHEEDILEPSEM